MPLFDAKNLAKDSPENKSTMLEQLKVAQDALIRDPIFKTLYSNEPPSTRDLVIRKNTVTSITNNKYFKSGQFAEDDCLRFFAKSHYQVQQGLFDAVFLVGLLEEDRYIGKMDEQSAFVSAYHQAIK